MNIRLLIYNAPKAVVFVSKRIDNKTFEKFVRDVKSLRAVYTDAKISTLMRTNPGNFSARVNGAKRPGQDFIDKFYQFWGTMLKRMAEGMDYEVKEDTVPISPIPSQSIPGHALFHEERLRRVEDSINRLDRVTSGLMERLVLNHLKLVDAHLSMLNQNAKGEDNRTREHVTAAG